MVREPIFGTELLGVGRITNPLCAKPICDILRTVVIWITFQVDDIIKQWSPNIKI